MNIITEELKLREKIVKFAIKYNNSAKAARRYHTSRQNVNRWLKRYDGNLDSLRPKSRRPKSHPNQHTDEELELIQRMNKHHRYRGLAHVYRKCCENQYKRSFGSMCKQIRKMNLNNKIKKKNVYKKSNYKPLKSIRPGEYVQIDIKYVPLECIGFKSKYNRYYQITAIDVATRKRVLEIVPENTTYTTSKFVVSLERKMGFEIDLIQTDNGSEFVNTSAKRRKGTLFEKTLKAFGIKHKRTRPYSPWQNGIVERSHRIDNENFYSKKRFKSEEEMIKALKRYNTIYNNSCRQILNFKSPNELVEIYNK